MKQGNNLFLILLGLICFVIIIFFLGFYKGLNNVECEDCSLRPAGTIEITKIVNNTCVCEEVDCTDEVITRIEEVEQDKKLLREVVK